MQAGLSFRRKGQRGADTFSAHNPVVVLDDRGRVGQVYSAEAVFARDGVGSGIRKLRGARRRRAAGGEEPRALGADFLCSDGI